MSAGSASKRAFVTGGTGFAGSHLCRTLIERGWRVTVLARPSGRTEPLEQLGVTLVRGDVRDSRTFADALRGADVVYHLAAAFREVKLSDADYRAVNVEGTRHVIEAAARGGVGRVVHCSTVGVHGDTGAEPVDETAPFDPPDFYCQSKLEGEVLARELFERHRLPGVVFRPVGLHGPGDTRFLKLFRGIRRGRFVMLGSGEINYHLTYIDDLCDGIVLCGEHPAAVGEAFILGGESFVTLNRFVAEVAGAVGAPVPRRRIPLWPVMAGAVACEAICRPLGVEPPLYPRRVEFFSKHRAFRIDKAKRILGYAPRVSVREGLQRTAEWYRDQGLL